MSLVLLQLLLLLLGSCRDMPLVLGSSIHSLKTHRTQCAVLSVCLPPRGSQYASHPA